MSRIWSWLSNKGSITLRVTCAVAVIAAMLLATGCSPKKPEAPTWDTKWSIPLTNKAYSIEDIFDELDEDNLIVDANGARIEITENIDSFEVDESTLSSTAINQNFNKQLGNIDLDAPDPGAPIETPLADFLPPTGGIVPDANFTVNNTLPAYDSYDWVVVESGTLYVKVTNNLGVNIDALTIEVRDSTTNSLLGTLTYPGGVAYQATATQSLALSDTVRNQFKTVASGHTPGGDVSGFTLSELKLKVESYFSNEITVSAARAEVPAVEKSYNQDVALADDGNVIEVAQIGSGTMTMTVNNQTGVDAGFTVKVPSFTNSSGDTLTLTCEADASESVNVTQNLANYYVRPEGSSSPQNISVLVSADIESSGTTKRNVSAADNFNVTTQISALNFSSVTGNIKQTPVDIETQTIDVDIPDGMDEAQLTDASLRIKFYNSCMLPANLNLTLTGNAGTTPLNISGTIAGRTSGSTQPRETVITVGGDSLEAFLAPPVPANITASGSATFSPNNDYGTVRSGDLIYGDVLVSSPLAFKIADTAVVDLDIESEEISDDAPDFSERVHIMIVNSDITSELPVGAQVTIYISTLPDDRMYTDTQNTVVVGPMSLLEAPIDTLTGRSNGRTSSTFVDTLTNSEVGIFDNPTVYIGKKVLLTTAGDDGIEIQSSDSLIINSSAYTEVTLGGDDW
ncbi:MAG: hypothetical protein GF307_09325 [candidate division Zixibacteria bacterium]|nr:hypothetical protein [candidate division Zixibacteria bacterium]